MGEVTRAVVAVILVLTIAVPQVGSVPAAGHRPLVGQGESRVLGPAVPTQPIVTYTLPQSAAYPLGVTTDPRGNVWFAEDNLDQIVELIPANSTFRYFSIPTVRHLAWIWFLVFDGSGNLWFSDDSQTLLWRLSPGGGFANYSAGLAQPYALALDASKDRIWFTSTTTNQVGYFLVDGNAAALGQVVTLHGQVPGPGPSGIVIGPGGTVFVAETFGGMIAELGDGNLTVLKTWKLPSGSEPVGLALDPSGEKLWFTNHATSFFGSVDIRSGAVAEYPTSLSQYGGGAIVSLPYWIALGGDGDVWFDEHFANRIARFDPGTLQLTEFPIPQNASSPLRIWLDQARGEVWFSEFSGNAIGVLSANSSDSLSVDVSPSTLSLSPSGEVTIKPSPTPAAPPEVSSTTFPTGSPDLNLSVRLTGNGSSMNIVVKVLTPGNYTLGVCYTYPGAIQCGYTSLVVGGRQGPDAQDYLIYGGLAVLAAAVIVLVYRESAGRRSSQPGGAKGGGSPSTRSRPL